MPKTNVIMIEEFITELIVTDASISAGAAIAGLVRSFPEAAAIEAAFAFVSMASALERPIFSFTDNDQEFATDMYRAIAAFTADIYAVETQDGPSYHL